MRGVHIALIGLCGIAVAAYLIRQSRDDTPDERAHGDCFPRIPYEAPVSSPGRRPPVAGDAQSPRILGDILIIESDGFETVHPPLYPGRFRIADDRSAWGEMLQHGGNYYLT